MRKERGGKRKLETKKANYNNKMNGKSREWVKNKKTKTLDMFAS